MIESNLIMILACSHSTRINPIWCHRLVWIIDFSAPYLYLLWIMPHFHRPCLVICLKWGGDQVWACILLQESSIFTQSYWYQSWVLWGVLLGWGRREWVRLLGHCCHVMCHGNSNKGTSVWLVSSCGYSKSEKIKHWSNEIFIKRDKR